MNSNHSNNYDNDDECFEAFFCRWSQSSDKLWASSNSSADEFLIYGSLKRGRYTRKWKSTEGVTDGEKLSQQKMPAPDPVNTNPWLKFSPDYQALQASSRMVPAMCEPDTSSASPPPEDSGSSHVACSASGSQRSQGWLFRGVELWLAQIQAVHYSLWIVRPQKAQLIFREELLAKEINSVLYIAYRLSKPLLFKKSRIHIWLKLLDF